MEGLRAERNEASDAIGAAKRDGRDADAEIARMREVSARIKELEGELEGVEADRGELAATIPNPPDPDAPDGETDEDAVVLREVGERPEFGFEIRDHLDIGRALGLIETEKAAAASGSRFAYLIGDLVLVELALIRFAVDLVGEEGFTPVVPPVLVREEPLYGTGFFPGEREMIYEVPKDELFLVGTSEVALAALHADEILERRARCRCATRASRPASGARPAPPARTPAGSSGSTSSTRSRCSRSSSPATRRTSTSACSPSRSGSSPALEIPYRVVDIPVGDLGAPAARKFDCEAWIPSQERYRELTSTSNTTDYQARRLGCRYRPLRGRRARARRHPERHRGRGRPHADRDHREPPAGGRLGLDTAGLVENGAPERLG